MKSSTVAAIAFGVVLAQAAGAQDLVKKLPDSVHKKTKALNQDYLFYRPKGVKAEDKIPLMIFLHGRSMCGKKIGQLMGVGRWMLFGNAEKHKLPLVMPSCLNRNGWNVNDLNLLLGHLKKTYKIDEDRTYLAGYSLGAFGAWAWAIDAPTTFAAVSPVSGGGDARKVGAIKHLPIWVFHGKKDPLVPHKLAEQMVGALKRSGAKGVKFTSYPDRGHDTHAVTFRNPELHKWFLQQTRKKARAK